jgi:hypothetical protein
MPMCCFGVRPDPNGGSAVCFEVFDPMTGAVVVSAMHEVEAEDDARRRDQHTGGPVVVTLCLGPAEFAALRAAVCAYLNRASHHQRVLEELYEFFTGRGSNRG